MEVYVLDDQLRRSQLIDRFESLIWTERYNTFGDFQLDIHSSHRNRSVLTEGTRLAILRSKRVMVIESIQTKEDSSGRSVLTVSGRSLEATMERIPVRRNEQDLNAYPEFTLQPGEPAKKLRDLFRHLMVTGQLNSRFNLPMYTEGSLYPANTIAEPETIVTLSYKPMDLYRAMSETAAKYGLGFRLYMDIDKSKLYFDVYTGDDRTSSQTTKQAVIFSPDLENLSNVTQYRSIEATKNAALVLAKYGVRWVYANDDVGPSLSGWDINSITVEVNSDLTGEPLQELLLQVGKEELSKYKPVVALDGELPVNSRYRYGVDYELGDLVEMRSEDGFVNRMRVTEQIFVSDQQGDREYPTLTVDEFIEPDTWSAWDANGVWDNAKGVWAFAGGYDYKDEILLNGGLEMGTLQEWTPWAPATISPLSKSTTPSNVRTGDWSLKVVTTTAGRGATGNRSNLAPTPVGTYRGGLWFKGASGDTYSFQLLEVLESDGTEVGGSPTVSIVSNGAWQNLEGVLAKTQEGSVMRVSITKATAGTFYVDDAYIRKI